MYRQVGDDDDDDEVELGPASPSGQRSGWCNCSGAAPVLSTCIIHHSLFSSHRLDVGRGIANGLDWWTAFWTGKACCLMKNDPAELRTRTTFMGLVVFL